MTLNSAHRKPHPVICWICTCHCVIVCFPAAVSLIQTAASLWGASAAAHMLGLARSLIHSWGLLWCHCRKKLTHQAISVILNQSAASLYSLTFNVHSTGCHHNPPAEKNKTCYSQSFNITFVYVQKHSLDLEHTHTSSSSSSSLSSASLSGSSRNPGLVSEYSSCLIWSLSRPYVRWKGVWPPDVRRLGSAPFLSSSCTRERFWWSTARCNAPLPLLCSCRMEQNCIHICGKSQEMIVIWTVCWLTNIPWHLCQPLNSQGFPPVIESHELKPGEDSFDLKNMKQIVISLIVMGKSAFDKEYNISIAIQDCSIFCRPTVLCFKSGFKDVGILEKWFLPLKQQSSGVMDILLLKL